MIRDMETKRGTTGGEAQETLAQDATEFYRIFSDLVRIQLYRDRDRLSSHGLSASGAQALDILVRRGEIGLNQLATELFVDKSTASRLVFGMEEKGYISRSTDPDDRRVVLLQVTPAGCEVHRVIYSENIDDAVELLRSFSDDIRQGMNARLRQIACTYALRAGVAEASVCLLPEVDSPTPFNVDLRIAGPVDLEEAFALLEMVGLPLPEIHQDYLGNLLVARDSTNEEIVGVASMESYGPVGLLHSVGVHPSYRKLGLGRTLVLTAVELVKVRGTREIYVINPGAEDCLAHDGWEIIEPDELPTTLRESRRLQESDRSTATVLRLRHSQ